VQTLYETLALRYLQLMDEGLREEFLYNTEAILVPSFVSTLEEKYVQWEGVIIQIEANKPLFVQQLRRLGALHQTAAKFQLFALTLKTQDWSEEHLRLNTLKRQVVERIVALLSHSTKPSIERHDPKLSLLFSKLTRYLSVCLAPELQPSVLWFFEQEIAKLAKQHKYASPPVLNWKQS
jgi:hypothetical protein